MEEELIVIDNTNVKKWEYENYVFLAELNGYSVEIVEIPFTESAEVYHERNTHGVPLEVIQRMMNDYEH
jgi:predicted kinase